MSEAHDVKPASATGKHADQHPLDALTGGAFSAATSGERAARVREWLGTQPSAERIQDVFKELSVRDKGAAKPLRERLDEIKRAKGQEVIAAEWAEKARALLDAPKLNIADAMAWQRDAAKAGAPLSREPLSALKAQLAERIKVIEDLQHRVQVQREAAVLLAQRIEVLSTKSWKDAQNALELLQADVLRWQEQAENLSQDASWPSVEAKFPPLLDASRSQLLVVWEAFQAALAQAAAAADDAAAPLPPVPVWAEELGHARAGTTAPAEGAAPASAKDGAAAPRAPRAPRKADPETIEKAAVAVREAVARLEQETAEGHGKASAGAAGALRAVLKEHGRHIDNALETQVNAALTAAGELEGWQRWSADRVREDLVARAEGLLNRPEGQALGGRKMQETLRSLREEWKKADQGSPSNHALWKRFDEACNQAHKVVEAWLDKIRHEASENKGQRLALIAEVKAWGEAQAGSTDWKAFNRALHQFGDRWRDAGHLGEKAFAELQPQWKQAISAAAAPLENAQKASLDRRHAMIDESRQLGEAPMLRIDAVKALQQRWQAEAQAVPLDRRQEQKLWDAFRKPIDDAFNRKTAEREQHAAALSGHDRMVLEASKALEAANATGDAQKIRAAMNGLEAALRGQAQAVADGQAAAKAEAAAAPAADGAVADADASATADAPVADADAAPGTDAAAETVAPEGDAPAPAAAPAPALVPAKRVVAVRGDDRPGMKKDAPAVPGRGGKFGGRDARPGGRPGDRAPAPGDNRFSPADRGGRFGDREPREDRGPRLGDAAFRAQREALEHAQLALRKLAAQAHGEALTQLMAAWEARDASQVPSVQELGNRVSPAVRGRWTQALGSAPAGGDAAEALLRLEMAAEVPTPAEQQDARRALQLKLLTRRNDPTPVQTWGDDAARVLAGPSDGAAARRLQNALKALLRK